jgi:hypothetical protein
MDNSLNSAVQKMGGNFLVAAFTPAMAFILFAYWAFQPFVQDIEGLVSAESLSFIESGIVLFLASTILGFTIYTIEIYTYKAFEGYVFILGKQGAVRDLFLKKHLRRYRKAIAKKQLIQKQLKKIDNKLQYSINHPTFGRWYYRRLTRLRAQQKQLNDIKYNLTANIDHNYPSVESYVMPTRFGNILRAAELYSERYGIDAVALWPKLVSAISDSNGIMDKINEANNQCQFLLNGALLATLFSIMCMIAAFYEGSIWWTSRVPNISDRNLVIFYVVLMILAVILARFFYEASLFNVEKFGEMIRTTYDLHRFNLLEALHLDLPHNLADEKKTWRKLSNFYIGNLDYEEPNYLVEEKIAFEYSHPDKKLISS